MQTSKGFQSAIPKAPTPQRLPRNQRSEVISSAQDFINLETLQDQGHGAGSSWQGKGCLKQWHQLELAKVMGLGSFLTQEAGMLTPFPFSLLWMLLLTWLHWDISEQVREATYAAATLHPSHLSLCLGTLTCMGSINELPHSLTPIGSAC